MNLSIVSTFALALWLILWSIGGKALDTAILAIAIILVAATADSLKKFLPGSDARGRG